MLCAHNTAETTECPNVRPPSLVAPPRRPPCAFAWRITQSRRSLVSSRRTEGRRAPGAATGPSPGRACGPGARPTAAEGLLQHLDDLPARGETTGSPISPGPGGTPLRRTGSSRCRAAASRGRRPRSCWSGPGTSRGPGPRTSSGPANLRQRGGRLFLHRHDVPSGVDLLLDPRDVARHDVAHLVAQKLRLDVGAELLIGKPDALRGSPRRSSRTRRPSASAPRWGWAWRTGRRPPRPVAARSRRRPRSRGRARSR